MIKYRVEKRGIDANAKDENNCTSFTKWEALIIIMKFIKYLVEKGADVYVKDGNAWTHLIKIGYLNNDRMIKIFWELRMV